MRRPGPAAVLLRPARCACGLALVAALAGCTSKADRAARERIFSPEEPARDVALAREKLDAAGAASDPALWQRLWRMDRQEVAARVGAHRALSEVSLRWTRPGRAVTLVEKHRFETDAAGRFRAQLDNSEDAGLEFVWADGRAYARGRYGPFRARRIDRAQQDRWREEATGALRTFHDLFDRRLRAGPPVAATWKERPVWRYVPTLGEPLGEAGTPPDVPPPLYGQFRTLAAAPPEGDAPARAGARPPETLRPGPDDDTARRLHYEARRTPREVSGELLVDRDTAVILKASLRGRLVVPPVTQGQPESALDLVVSYELVPDPKVSVAPPADVQEARLAHAVNNPLWFLGDEAPAPAAGPEEREDDADEGADERPDDAKPAGAKTP